MSGSTDGAKLGYQILMDRFYMELLKNIKIAEGCDPLVEHLRNERHLNRHNTDAIYGCKTDTGRCKKLLDKLSGNMQFSDKVFFDLTSAIGKYGNPKLQQEMEAEYKKRKSQHQHDHQNGHKENCPRTSNYQRNLRFRCARPIPESGGLCSPPKASVPSNTQQFQPVISKFQSKVVCISESNLYIILILENKEIHVYDKKKQKLKPKCLQNRFRIKSLHWFYDNYFFVIGLDNEAFYCFDLLKVETQNESLISEEWRDYVNFDPTWMPLLVPDKNLFFFGTSDGQLLTFRVLLSDDIAIPKCELLSESKFATGLSALTVSPPGPSDSVRRDCVLWSKDEFTVGEIVCGLCPRQTVKKDELGERRCDAIVQCHYIKCDVLAVCYTLHSYDVVIELWHYSIGDKKFICKHTQKLRDLTTVQGVFSVEMFFEKHSSVLVFLTDREYILLAYNSGNQTLTEFRRVDLDKKGRKLSQHKLVKADEENTAYLVLCYDNNDAYITKIDCNNQS